MSNVARKEAFWRIGETCPKVLAAIHDAVRSTLDDGSLIEGTDAAAMSATLADAAFDAAVKEGTDKLRDALIDCEEERLRAEKERDDALEEIETLQRRIDRLETEVADAEGERDDANQRADEAEARIAATS